MLPRIWDRCSSERPKRKRKKIDQNKGWNDRKQIIDDWNFRAEHQRRSSNQTTEKQCQTIKQSLKKNKSYPNNQRINRQGSARLSLRSKYDFLFYNDWYCFSSRPKKLLSIYEMCRYLRRKEPEKKKNRKCLHYWMQHDRDIHMAINIRNEGT